MPRGRVKWFSPEKGYGFIVLDPDTEAFVHFTSIIGEDFRMLHNEELVEFELIDTKRGYQAINVKRLGNANPNDRPANESHLSITPSTG